MTRLPADAMRDCLTTDREDRCDRRRHDNRPQLQTGIGSALITIVIALILVGCTKPVTRSLVLAFGQLSADGGFIEGESGFGIGVPTGALSAPLNVEIHDVTQSTNTQPASGFKAASAIVQYKVSRTASANDSWFLLALPFDSKESLGPLSVAIRSPAMSTLDGESTSAWQLIPGTLYPEDQTIYALVKWLPSEEGYLSAMLVAGGLSGTVVSAEQGLQPRDSRSVNVDLTPLGTLDASVPIVVQSTELTDKQRLTLQDTIAKLKLIERFLSAGFEKIVVNGAPVVRQKNPPVLETPSYNIEFTTAGDVCPYLGRYIALSGTVSVCLSDTGDQFDVDTYLSSKLGGHTIIEIILHELFHAVQLGHSSWCVYVNAVNNCKDTPDDAAIATIEATARLSQQTLLAIEPSNSPQPYPPIRHNSELPFDVTTPLFLVQHSSGIHYRQQDFWQFITEHYFSNDFRRLRGIFESGNIQAGIPPMSRVAINDVLVGAGTSLGNAYWAFVLKQLFQDNCSLSNSYYPEVQPYLLDGEPSSLNPLGIPVALTSGRTSGRKLTTLTTDFLILELETARSTTALIRIVSSGGRLATRTVDLDGCAIISDSGDASIELQGGSVRHVLVIGANASSEEDAHVEVLVERAELEFSGSVTYHSVLNSFETGGELSIQNCPGDYLHTISRVSSSISTGLIDLTVQFEGLSTSGGTVSTSIVSYSAEHQLDERSSSFEESYQYNPVADETYHYSLTQWAESEVSLGEGYLVEGASAYWLFRVPYVATYSWGGSNSDGQTWSDSSSIEGTHGVEVYVPIDVLLREGRYIESWRNESIGEPIDKSSSYQETCGEASRAYSATSYEIANPGYTEYALEIWVREE